MATITLITWLAALGMFIWLSRAFLPHLWSSRGQDDTDGALVLTTLLVVWVTIVFAITSALISDIYGASLGGFTYWVPLVFSGESPTSGVTRLDVLFIAGLVALCSCSLGALAYNLLRGRSTRQYGTGGPFGVGRLVSLVVQGIGLVASILGIISFYLDHM